ncbi:MAG: beta-N-acetylhexosaminidase [Verrucomicrobiota bacterium]
MKQKENDQHYKKGPMPDVGNKPNGKSQIKSQIAGILFSLLAATGFAAANPPAILPVPQKMVVGDGAFKLAPETRICTDAASRATGEFLAAQLRQSTGYKFKISTVKKGAAKGDILITTANAKTNLGAEGYELTVAPDSVVIRAPESAGGFYGAQTLLQLLPPEVFAAKAVAGVAWAMPCVQIEDQPRFKWRGMHLDVSRHFFSKAEVKKVLDFLALHKLNIFHWHLVDESGWRIEIKIYPKLTEVAAWRNGIGWDLDPKSSTAYGPDGRYGGFYTQDDIREIVAYAQCLHITVVPEIEMPGHSAAALDAYPEFSCSDKSGYNVYCAGKDGTFEFLQNVLAEIIPLFPGEYIHIGGDEVNKRNWKQCAKCQARIKNERLKNEEELQSYFIRRMEKFINAHGKTLIGWSEILQGGLAQNAAVMDWIGGAEAAASAGHDVVMTPQKYCYFDHRQAAEIGLEPTAHPRFLPLSRVYDFEPISAKLDPRFQSHILGAQGNLWTEDIASLKHLEYMTFPRLSALAEVTWSPKSARNWKDFNRRLQVQFQRFDQLGINYRRETAVEIGQWTPAQLASAGGTVEWDAGQISVAGNYRVSFDLVRGENSLKIEWVALLEDGRELMRDTHLGIAGYQCGDVQRNSVYILNLPGLKAGAHYSVRAQVAGAGGTDSRGNVSLQLIKNKL